QVYSAVLPEKLRPRKLNVHTPKLVNNFHDYPDIAMDKQIWKKRSGEARLKRKMILNEKRPSRFRISPESEKMPHHANDGIVKPYY
ncbi:hypothetical protein A2U01_0029716, partial [Trifolium medium]|nr:hypothetical protein [Trifolium medium]